MMNRNRVESGGSRTFSTELNRRRQVMRAGGLSLLLARSAGRLIALGVLLAVVDLIWVPDSDSRETLLALAGMIWLISVIIGVPRPDEVDKEAVLSEFPFGQGEVQVVLGGLELPYEDPEDDAVMADAIVSLNLDVPVQ